MSDSADTMQINKFVTQGKDGIWSAGIDMRDRIRGWYYNAIECNAISREEAIARRDAVFAALSASGTKSDGGHGGQPYASADAVEGASAPNALSGRQEGRTGGVVGATQTPGSSMSSGQTKPITAGQAPGPSDPIPSQPDELEAIAETIWRAEYRRATGRERSIPWSEASPIDQERYRYVAAAILAMQAERRGATPVVHAINGPFASPISKMLVDDPNSASGKRLVDAPLPPAPIVGLEPVERIVELLDGLRSQLSPQISEQSDDEHPEYYVTLSRRSSDDLDEAFAISNELLAAFDAGKYHAANNTDGLTPVAFGEFYSGKLATCRPDKSDHCTVPLVTIEQAQAYAYASASAQVADAVAKEREACATDVDDLSREWVGYSSREYDLLKSACNAIRARGQK